MSRNARALVAVAGATAVGLLVATLNRANERRFRALERELRTAAEEGRARDGDEAPMRPVVVWAPAPPAAPSAPPPPENPNHGAPRDEPAVPSDAEYAHSVGVAFSQDARDAAWAQETERSIGGSLRGIAETSVIDAVECRRNLCRVSVRHPDQEKYSAFIDRLVARANEMWSGEVYWYRDSEGDDGPVRSTMYFGKPGASIHALALAE